MKKIIRLIKNIGLAMRNSDEYAYPETYGAVGDGVTDDSDAIQAALDYAFEHKIPTVLKNKYKVTKSLNVHGWCHIIGCDPNFDDYHSTIYFFPAAMGTLENPTALFVNTDKEALEGKHSFDNIKAVNKVGTYTAVFAFSCPIDHGSHVRNCRFSDFSIVFDCYILHVSYIDHNTFGGVQYAFTRRNITDSYICYNYISGYRPKAPYCFYGGYITHSEISHNFFDFWMGVFEYGMYTKFIDNIFDYCFMVFGYSDQPGRNNTTGIGKNIYECVIANNEFPNCAGCATSPDGFGSVRDTIATSEQGANKIILLDRMPVGSAIFIACYSGSTAEDFKLGGYYYTFSNSVTGNNFMGAGVFVACTNAGGFNFSGNKYVIKNGTYYLEDFTNAWFSIEYNSNTGNNHMPCHIDLFEMVPFKRLPNMNGASSNTHEGTGFPFAFALPHGLKLIYDHKQLTVDYISGSYVDALGNTVTAK